MKLTAMQILGAVREVEDQMMEQLTLNDNHITERYVFLQGKREGLLNALALIEA